MSAPAKYIDPPAVGRPYEPQRDYGCRHCGQSYITSQGGIVVRVECQCGRINESVGPQFGVCPECEEKPAYCRCEKRT